jgi:hypothetical protein
MDKLQVFISWSGERAHSVAKVVKTWLPDVVRNAEPWLSSEDLQKGLQWLPELNKNLSATGFGLIVLTAENKNAPWLVFEAGVISKALPDKNCCPLLCDLKQTDVSGPLAQFQGTTLSSKEDMLKLVKTMNDASGSSKVDDDRLTKWFNMSWEDFARRTSEITTAKKTDPSPAAKAGPTERELIEEVLQTVRRLAIEPRARTEELLGRLEGPLVVPPEVLLRDFSRMPPESQMYFFELLSTIRRGGDTESLATQLRELAMMERHGARWVRKEGTDLSAKSPKP